MKYSHLFFDLDGTLWDLTRNTRAAMEILFDRYAAGGMRELNFEDFLSTYLRHNEHVWALYRQGRIEKSYLRIIRFERTFADMKSPATPEMINRFADDFIDICPRQPHLVDGAREVLEYCAGRHQLHIITNGFFEIQGLKLEAGGITGFFREIINSEQSRARKPQSAIFRYALEKTGASRQESLMIGDDWHADILGARDFGMDQAWLQNGIESHNYTPTYTLTKLSDLLSFI